MYRILLPLAVLLAVLGVAGLSRGAIVLGMIAIAAAFVVGPGVLGVLNRRTLVSAG